MEVKPGYKLTEAGVIPEDWSVRALGSLGAPGRPAIKAGPFGSSLTKDTYVREGFKVYGQEQVIRGDYQYGDYYIPRDRFIKLQSCAVEPGDVLMSLVGTAGRLLIVPPGAPKGVINPRLIRFAFDPHLVSPDFFQALLETDTYQSILSRAAQGGTMGVLNAGLLRPLSIPVPPRSEQDAIAEALRDSGAFAKSLEQLIAKKRDIKQGAMQELLTGKRRLRDFGEPIGGYKKTPAGAIPSDWAIRPLGADVKLLSGHHVLAQDCNTGGQGTPYLTGPADFAEGSIRNSKFTTKPSTICRAQDVLVTVKGSGSGTVVFSDGAYCISRQLMAIRVTEWDSRYLYFALLREGSLFTAAAAGLIPGLSRNDILTKEVPLPPTRAEQDAIARAMGDMDADIAALEAKLAKARQIKQGMMQNLLTGKIRLV